MRNILTILFSGIFFVANAQESNEIKPSVEKSIFGIQTGYLGIWAHKESRLTNTMTLRSEVGFDSGFWDGSFFQKTGFLLTPAWTIEPRFYYDLEKRNLKSKNTDRNSGNFLALKANYQPGWFVISNYNNVKVISNISIVPTWGIRRQIGKHFNYEAGAGLRYTYIFSKKAGYFKNRSDVALSGHLRIGYTF